MSPSPTGKNVIFALIVLHPLKDFILTIIVYMIINDKMLSTGTEDAGDGPLSAETVRAAARACRMWADEQTPAPLRMWPSRDHRSRIKQPHPDVQRRTAKLSQPVRYALLLIRLDFRWSLRVMRIAVRIIWIVRPARSTRAVSAAWV